MKKINCDICDSEMQRHVCGGVLATANDPPRISCNGIHYFCANCGRTITGFTT